MWGSEWCKQRNSEKDRRLNNEQWSRVESVTLDSGPACIESHITGLVMFYVDMWEPSPGHTQVTRASGDESWGQMGGTLETLTRRWLFIEMFQGMEDMFFSVWPDTDQ